MSSSFGKKYYNERRNPIVGSTFCAPLRQIQGRKKCISRYENSDFILWMSTVKNISITFLPRTFISIRRGRMHTLAMINQVEMCAELTYSVLIKMEIISDESFHRGSEIFYN